MPQRQGYVHVSAVQCVYQAVFGFVQLQTGVNIVRNEGVLALYSGLGPAIGRGLFYGGEQHLP